MPTVVISPLNVANSRESGGHLWVYMQYAQGLRRLGCDVYWLERFRRGPSAKADAARISKFLSTMERFGLRGKTILYVAEPADIEKAPRDYIGLSRLEAEEVFQRSDLLLNFHYAIAPDLLCRFRRTALVDIDPGLLQFWISRNQLSVPRHDLYFTTGETVGTLVAPFPDCGLTWVRIRPPVCLEEWPCALDPRAERFTTISHWGSDDWIIDDGEVYENTKRVALLEFADLPRLTDQPLELALFLRTRNDAEDRRDLERRGWRVRHSREVAGTPERYRAYIQRSRGEFSCAKRSCIRFRNAWISDPTLCYLASGKPVVVQDTGPSRFLPNREGMFRFSTLNEAAEALDAINTDYVRHCRAAREIAESLFDAKKILGEILDHALSQAPLSRVRRTHEDAPRSAAR